jgi:uncharacterized protein (TIGR02145 family)
MLKKSFWFISMIIMGVSFLTLTGCDPEDENTTDETTVTVTVPVLKTITSTNVTMTSATFGGKITSNGKGTVTARGICWDTVKEPKLTSHVVSSPITADTINFTGDITGLTANKKYYVRAYATNSAGTAYGNEVIFSTQGGTIGTVTDIEGNVYHTIIIGTQVWMVENLRTTKYNDGTDIPLVTDSAAWSTLTTPGYCWYNNDLATYKSDYGALYNWYTIYTGNLCPTGWHVPTIGDWKILSDYLIGDSITGAKLKEIDTTHWNFPNTGATNESGFTALPGGGRNFNGSFDLIGKYGYWWTNSQYIHNDIYYQFISYVGSNLNQGTNSKNLGFSVRCVKD